MIGALLPIGSADKNFNSAATLTIVHPSTWRPVADLTAEMAIEHFGGGQTLRLRLDTGQWARRPLPIIAVASQILGYLSIAEQVFWTPPTSKIEILTI